MDGQYREAEAIVLEKINTTNNRGLQADCNYLLGIIHSRTGRMETAIAHLTIAKHTYYDQWSWLNVSLTVRALARCFLDRNPIEAERYIAEAWKYYEYSDSTEKK